MTPREIMIANIECRCDDRIGFNFSGENRLNDICGASYEHGIKTKKWEEGKFEFSVDIWGNTWHRIIGGCNGGEIFKPVLEDWAMLDNLELPDLGRPEQFQGARDLAASDTDAFRIGWVPWVFSTTRYMRKMEIYFMDLIDERERIDILHERVCDIIEKIIVQYGEAGMDGIMFCEDLGVQDRTLIGPAMWDDVFRPHYERLTAKAHSYGMKVLMHSCGYNWALIDNLCEAGIDCLQFDQPAVYDQPALAKKLRGYGVGLFSPCDIQKVLPTGDRALIESETERLVKNFRGGFIAKNYPDLHGIGVQPEWDMWAYDTFRRVGIPQNTTA